MFGCCCFFYQKILTTGSLRQGMVSAESRIALCIEIDKF